MNIKCGLCGKDLVVADGLTDGQHILCPYCGERTVYRKSARIELPTGTERRRQAPDASAQADSTVAEIKIKRPEVVPEEVKKPLRVIRKNENPSENQRTAEKQMVARRLHMAEEHVRFYEEMRDIEYRRKMREKINGILMLLSVVLCAAGIYWYVGYRKEQRIRTELALAEERNRLDAEHAENERKERARRKEEEAANREKRLAEEKRQKEENARLQTERARAANALQDSRVLYRKACALFGDGEFDFLKTLPTNSLPGKVAGEFYFLLPFLDNGEIVVCQSSTNGIESVCRLDGTGKRTSFDADTFLASLQGKDYLMVSGDKVYFQSKRKKPHVAQISKIEVVDLAKEFFGDIGSEVKRLNIDPQELSFEIVFIPKDTKKVIIADTVVCGANYSLSKVREAIEESFPLQRTSVVAGKKPKFKRTVVFWNGAQIKKGIDGTMYVPKTAPRAFPHWYRRERGWTKGAFDRYWHQKGSSDLHAYWQSLYNEAKEQESAEQRFYAELEGSAEMHNQRVKSRAEQVYSDKIDRIYNEGALYFRAKIAK